MKAILTDVTKCIGCAECVNACKVLNNLAADKPREWQKNDGLSARNWTSVLHKDGQNIRKQCRHCHEPACVNVCPVGALRKTESGAVVYDKDKCMGCRYCMMACPYGIPRYDWDSPVPYIEKCILCHENIESGKIEQPACTKACPVEATIYGERDELIKEAKLRIVAAPDKYLNHVYGEKEVGGTNVLYITSKDCPLDFMLYYNHSPEKAKTIAGYPNAFDPLPETTKLAMNAVPFAFIGMGTIMSGAYWIIKRRQKLMENSQEKHSEEENTEGESNEQNK